MDAGQPGAVTIATNMAGRGVDIKLGEGVVDLGGLYVLATERHESRRIDNQLRGRSGRQGDPGLTRFYLSGEDDLVRLFAGDRIKNIMERFKLPDDQPMEAKILSNQIENAQKKVEEQNFVARKNVLKYDDVMNTQRVVIYEQRRRVLEGDDLSEDVRDWIREVVEANVQNATEAEFNEEWDLNALVQQMQALYGTDMTVQELTEEVELEREALIEEFVEDALETYDEEEEQCGPELMREIERYVMLQVVDSRWREPSRLDGLPARRHPPARDGSEGPARRVPRRGSCDVQRPPQRDPRGGRPDALPRAGRAERAGALEPDAGQRQPRSTQHETAAGLGRDRRRGRGSGGGSVATAFSSQGGGSTATAAVNEHKDVGRNDPCWCGSRQEVQALPRRLIQLLPSRSRWAKPAFRRGNDPSVAETAIPLEAQLEEIGAQLAWVRDYL